MIHQSRNERGGKEMKKLIVLSLAGLLILAFVATVNAQKLEIFNFGLYTTPQKSCQAFFLRTYPCPLSKHVFINIPEILATWITSK